MRPDRGDRPAGPETFAPAPVPGGGGQSGIEACTKCWIQASGPG